MTEGMKAEYTSHQFQGAAGIWWSQFRTTFPADVEITWDQFWTAFRSNYIPAGLMKMKTTEFMQLTQGTKTLTAYLLAVNNLSHYAPTHVDTDEKKIDCFDRGLGTKLVKTMANSPRTAFNDFIIDALT
jgi:hypothetical protein